MHVEQVWGASSKVKILRTLAQPSFPQVDATQLAAETGLSVAGVRKALRDLASTGIVLPISRGRVTYYALNADHSMAASIREAFRAEVENQGVEHLVPTFWNHLVQVVDRIAERDGVRFVLLFGSITQPPIYPGADVDLLVGMDPGPLTSGARSLEALDETVMGHRVHVVAMGVGAFEEKLRLRDPFVESVFHRHVLLYVDADYQLPSSTADRAGPARRTWAGGPWRSWGHRGGW